MVGSGSSISSHRHPTCSRRERFNPGPIGHSATPFSGEQRQITHLTTMGNTNEQAVRMSVSVVALLE